MPRELSVRLEITSIPSSLVTYAAFISQGLSSKDCEKRFPHSFRAVQRDSYHTLYHCLRKEFRGQYYVSASGIPAVTLMGRIILSTDYVALISKCLFFHKTQIYKPSCGHKEKANEPMCFSGLKVEAPCSHTKKCCLCHYAKNHR